MHAEGATELLRPCGVAHVAHLEVCLGIRRSVWVAHVARVQMGFVYNLQGAGSQSILKLPAQGQRHMACILARAKNACSCWSSPENMSVALIVQEDRYRKAAAHFRMDVARGPVC